MTPNAKQGAVDGSDLARAALLETVAEHGVGTLVNSSLDESGLIVHEFACELPGYPGWRWTVVVAHDTDTGRLTVCDAVLLPGEGALVPPAWVPWSQRVQAGDLGPGDLLPADPDDPRLEPGYAPAALGEDDQDVLDAVWELGLGRERVLSILGRDEAAQRWLRAGTGPSAAEARLAPHPCSTCGFLVMIKGALGAEFGVCSNELSPADGRVVNVGYGCGAHSGITVSQAAQPLPRATLDENEYEAVTLGALESTAQGAAVPVEQGDAPTRQTDGEPGASASVPDESDSDADLSGSGDSPGGASAADAEPDGRQRAAVNDGNRAAADGIGDIGDDVRDVAVGEGDAAGSAGAADAAALAPDDDRDVVPVDDASSDSEADDGGRQGQ